MSERDWRLYIADMINFSERALSYTYGLDQFSFLESGITYDATLRNLELIGEAASKVPFEIREAHSEIPWRMIIGTRNRLIHGYLGIDDDVVWSIVESELPNLVGALAVLLEESENGK